MGKGERQGEVVLGKKLYIGNISYDMTEDDIKEVFGQIGEVLEVKIVRKLDSGFSRGFGFVTMGSEADAIVAIERFDNSELEGRLIRVSDATPKELLTGGA